MLQQRQQETQDETRLQSYLDELQKPMTTLGDAARQEWREEAEGHLRSLIAAHEELGATRAESVRAALAQFGEPQRIGAHLRQATARQVARDYSAARLTERIIKCTAVSLLPAIFSFLTFVLLYVYTDNEGAQAIARSVAALILLLGPFLNGWTLGGLLPSFRNELRRIRSVCGSRAVVRLKAEWAILGAATVLQLGLFWSMLRILNTGSTTRIFAADFLPALIWIPITLGIALWRSRRVTAGTSAGDNTAPA